MIPIAYAHADGVYGMMGGGMMGMGYFTNVFLFSFIWLIIAIDLVLFGIWLFQKINRKK